MKPSYKKWYGQVHFNWVLDVEELMPLLQFDPLHTVCGQHTLVDGPAQAQGAPSPTASLAPQSALALHKASSSAVEKGNRMEHNLYRQLTVLGDKMTIF